ncbi:MAG: YbaB/EbfC family nucleoid-associated protein [Desulfobulbaceae bacterium]|nr:MAG: YbaB/EbfC family nucleoid-associated protein [Desulfobulbaceae bacterium]
MDINGIMQQAQQMQGKIAKIQQDLAKMTITGSAGGGMVQVLVTGLGEVISVKIEQQLLTPDETDLLQDLIAAATNDGLRKAKETGKQAMGQLTHGINIPGLNNIL